MTADEINIPKITPDSILVPKTELKEDVSSNNGSLDAQPTPQSPVQPRQKMGQGSGETKTLLIKIGIGFMALILFLLVAAGIPALLTYQKGMALYKSVKNLEAAAKSQDLTQIKTQ